MSEPFHFVLYDLAKRVQEQLRRCVWSYYIESDGRGEQGAGVKEEVEVDCAVCVWVG